MQKKYMEKKLSEDERNNLSMVEMKEILQAASRITKEEIEDKEHSYLRKNAMAILSKCGKASWKELIPELWNLVEHPDPYFRDDAVTNLGRWFLVPEFKQKSYEIFLHDEDHNVKFRALGSWVAYHRATKDKKILEELYKILINDYYENDIRDAALMGIFEVIGIMPETFSFFDLDLIYYCKTSAQFNAKAPWEEVTAVLKQHAPEVLRNYPIRKTKYEHEQDIQQLKARAEQMIRDKISDRVIQSITLFSLEEIEEIKRSIGL